MSSFLSNEYFELAQALERWDGSVESALALRRRLKTAKNPRGNSEDPREGMLRALTTFYRKYGGRGASIPAARVLGYLQDPGLRALLRPIFGDPDAGVWPHQVPFTISEDDAQAAMLLPTDVDGDSYPRFVRVMYAARVRLLWVSAADVLARLALREPCEARANRSREFLAREWRDLFPDGLPDDWPSGGFGTYKVEGRSKASHWYRHLLRLSGQWLALGGDPALLGGATARSFAVRELPRVAADASAVWLCLQALLAAGATRVEVEDLIPSRLAETQADIQAEAILRKIAGSLPPGHVLIGLIERHLAQPRWLQCNGMEQVDALDGWVETAGWLKHRGRRTLLAAMLGRCQAAAELLSLVLDGELPEERPYDALLGRLRRLLDREAFLAAPQEDRSLLIVEAHRLLDHPDLRDLSWARLAAACGEEVEGPGPVGVRDCSPVAVRAGIALTIARWTENAPQILLRDIAYPEEVVLSLASVESQKIDIQVAVQAERLLREAPGASARIRFVWKLLQRAPGNKAFTELQDILRRDPMPEAEAGDSGAEGEASRGAAIARVVAAAAKLYQLQSGEGQKGRSSGGKRGGDLEAGAEGREVPEIAEAPTAQDYIAVFLAMAEHLHGDRSRVAKRAREILAHIEASYGALAVHLESSPGEPRELIPTEEWIQGVETWLGVGMEGAGRDAARRTESAQEQGLRSWSGWLREPFPALAKTWRSLTQVLREVRSARSVSRERGDAVRAAVRAMREAMGGVRWPERSLLDQQLTALLSWTEHRVEEGIQDLMEIRAVEEAVRKGHRDEVAEKAVEVIGKLSDEMAVRMHHLLLDGRPEVAREVREAQAGRDRRLAVAMLDDALRDAITRRDEAQMVAFATTTDPAPGSAAIQAAYTALQNGLSHRRTRAVSKSIGGRVALTPWWSRLRMPAIGAIAGPLLVLDVGKDWDALIPKQGLVFGPELGSIKLLAILCVAFVLSFTILVTEVWGQLRREPVDGKLRYLAKVSWRVLPTYGFVFAVAAASALGVLLTLPESGGYSGEEFLLHWLLWASLSLFLGLFMGLLLQGKRFLDEE